MKKKNFVALILALVSICAFGLTGCTPTDNPNPSTAKIVNTPLGLVHTTDKVKNPSNDVLIEVFSAGAVVAKGENELTYTKPFQKNDTYGGDIIRITSDYQYIKLEMLDMEEAVIYSPTGEYVFQIPSTAGSTAWQQPNYQVAYPAEVFTRASNTIVASVATAEEIAEERNLAMNPYDFMYINELNVETATDLAEDGSLPADSISVETGEVIAFPHAYANRFTTGNNRGSFLARNAIDGDFRTGKGHINYGFQSWGGGRAPTTNTSPGTTGPAWTQENNYGYYDDLTFVVYFGRPVTLNELGFVMRADDTGSVRHDIHFSGMTAEFSNGTSQVLDGFVFSEDEQKVPLTTPVTTTYVRLKDFVRAWDDTLTEEQAKTSGNWTALSEFAAYGTDSAKNTAATKTTVKNTFGNPIVTKTNEFSASDLKEILDFASVDAQTSVAASSTPRAWWRDAVLYSALTEAYTTAGSLDAYLYTRHASDRWKYTIQSEGAGRSQKSTALNNILVNDEYSGIGLVSDFGDDYLVGETYLMMDNIAPVKEGLNNYKLFNTIASNDAHMLDSPSWSPNYNRGANFYNNNTGGPPVAGERPLPDGILDWWWCDAIYMGLNNFTFMTNQTGDGQYLEKAFESYKYWRGILRCDEDNHSANHHMNRPAGGSNSSALTECNHGVDTKDGRNAPWGLWHRDTDNANYLMNNWRNAQASELPLFWGRGNAWVFAALAKQMMYVDKNLYPEIYNEYKEDFIMMAETLKAHQTEQGHWRASIIDPNHHDGKESTGTSGFVYGIAVGVQLGILPANEYMDVVVNGFNALLDMRYEEEKTINGITGRRMGYMQDVGYDAVSYPGEETAARMINPFGYGLFIHAASAVMRMCSDYTPVEVVVPADAQFGVAKVPEYRGVKP